MTTKLRPAIEARGITRRFGPVLALNGLDLAIEPGRVTALLGPNGAGKTTFVNLVLGRDRPDAGTLTTLGANPGSATARRGSGVMLQSAALVPQLTVYEHLRLYSGYYGAATPDVSLLARLGMASLAGRRYGTLSGGQQRRVQFALALCGQPALLVLDEPTVALDAESRRLNWAAIKQQAADGAAVLLTTHLLEEAETLADRVVLLSAGRIIADGTPSAIRARVAEQRIRCRSRLGLDELRQLPGVLGVTRETNAVLLRTSDAETALRGLLALDPTISDLEVARASLEDALDSLLQREAA
jgi:ABC-2 type transport system ATP-binding protein